MKHLKQKLLLTALLLLAVVNAHADKFTVDGINYTTNADGTTCYVARSSGIGAVVIPAKVSFNGTEYTVTSIYKEAFFMSSTLTSIDIPNTVETIGSNAFYACHKLTSVSISNGVKSIGNGAFECCDKLSSITIPNSIISIGDRAFRECSSLSSMTIPNSVTSIGASVFSQCSSLLSVTIPSSVESIGDYAFYRCTSLSSITIPNSVTSIGEETFSGCSSLSSITIPNSVTSIGNAAFYDCANLSSITVDDDNPIYDSRYGCNALIKTDVNQLILGCKNSNIPNDITSIGDQAFRRCTGLTSITIPNGVTSIGSRAFDSCYQLSSISIPNTVKSIGDGAFGDCKKLSSVTIPNGVTSIGNTAFGYCTSLTSISIPNSVTSIGWGAFWWCSGLTNIIIPNSVTTIEEMTFQGCSSITSILIPSSVTKINNSALYGCDKLATITVLCTTPPVTGYDTLPSTTIQSATLYVPESSIETYQSTSPWSDFGQILPYQATKIELTDATPVSYITDNYYDELDYTRTFNNTNWQALYVPFSMEYEDWAEDFEVARLNNVNQYDDDNDGTVDRTVLEVIKLAEGSKTEANTPYMIKAKETGEKTITVADATLYKTEETSHDVTSWETKFTFTGTYHTVTDMATNGYYALAGGRLQQATSDAVTLSPMRWYLSVTDRNGNPQNLAKVISVVFDDGEATGISEVNTTTRSNAIYSINGSFAGTDRSRLTKGIYVSGGKKIIIK